MARGGGIPERRGTIGAGLYASAHDQNTPLRHRPLGHPKAACRATFVAWSSFSTPAKVASRNCSGTLGNASRARGLSESVASDDVLQEPRGGTLREVGHHVAQHRRDCIEPVRGGAMYCSPISSWRIFWTIKVATVLESSLPVSMMRRQRGIISMRGEVDHVESSICCKDFGRKNDQNRGGKRWLSRHEFFGTYIICHL